MNSEAVLASGNSVIFSDVKLSNPLLDSPDGETLLVSVPLPGRVQVKTREGVEFRPDMVLVVLSSRTFNPETRRFEDKPEFFEARIDEFTKRGWFAKVPTSSVLEQRWEAEKIKEFLDGASPEADIYALFEKIRLSWTSYMDFEKNPNAETYLSVWTIGTYFYSLFEYYPYTKFGGVRGVGKTKAGNLLEHLCFNASIFAKATPSSIYRYVENSRGTQIIDEGESLANDSEELAAYYQVLNSGYQANGGALLTNKDTMRAEKVPTYSPKAICSIGGLRETLEDRAFEIIVYKSNRREITDRTVPKGDAPEWKALRNGLYLALFQKWKEVKEAYDTLSNQYQFDGRFWDLAKPLIALAKVIDSHAPEGRRTTEAALLSFLRGCLKAKAESAQATDSGSVLFHLLSALKKRCAEDSVQPDYAFRIPIKDIVEEGVKVEGEGFAKLYSARRIAGVLKNLRLYNKPKRSSASGGFTFLVSLQEATETARRYNLETEDTEDTEPTEPVSDTPSPYSLDGLNEAGLSKSHSEDSVSSVSSGEEEPKP